MDRDQRSTRTINLGLFANILLSALKTIAGIFGHSPALLADGINSCSDVAYYVVVKIFMHHARKPADPEHPYGHRQLESIAAIVVGAFIITTGIAIFWESINKVYDFFQIGGEDWQSSDFVIYIAIFTFVLKIFLFYFTRLNCRKTQNPTLKALQNDHLNDIMAALAVLIGVLLSRVGYAWMDPAAGALVAIYIFKTGIGIVVETASDLMAAFPDDKFKHTVYAIALDVPGVRRIDDLGLHRFGPYYNVIMTIAVDGRISVDDGHGIADEIEHKLRDRYPEGLRQVHVHYHPDVPQKKESPDA